MVILNNSNNPINITNLNEPDLDYINWNYDRAYHIEEKEMSREGWYNPKKILMPQQLINHNIKLNIRNQLPKKFKKYEKRNIKN